MKYEHSINADNVEQFSLDNYKMKTEIKYRECMFCHKQNPWDSYCNCPEAVIYRNTFQQDLYEHIHGKTLTDPNVAEKALDVVFKDKPPYFKEALKFDSEKVPMHLLSNEALKQIAAVLDFGQNKYAAHNWRNGFKWSRVLGAAMRHLHAFNDGEDKDPESGLSHLAHLGCCVMFLLEFEKTHRELDDRFKLAHNEENKDGK